jgi:HD-GYP domain-containing protein (c-di-GMP phosphodiesterase class II)
MVEKSQKKFEFVELFYSILEDKDVKKYLKLIQEYDKETYEHSIRVGFLSVYFGNENSFSKEELKLLCYAGLLHDLGKIDIKKRILRKRSKLNEKERKEINEHSRRGFLRLKNFKIEKIREIIIRSHEFQKKLYPRQKERRSIRRNGKERRKNKREFCKLAQILAIADMYDALSNKRAYKKQLGDKKIKNILEKEFTGEKIYKKKVLERINIFKKLDLNNKKK